MKSQVAQSMKPSQTLQGTGYERQYVITHKDFRLPSYEHLVPIQVGGAESLGILRDNAGDNIADKNASWCELTAVYWIWKHDRVSRVIGINHYRRYFQDLQDPAAVRRLLKQYDLIVPEPEPLKETAWEQYVNYCGKEKDLKALRQIVKRLHPEDLDAFDEVMSSGSLSLYNMMIAPRPLFDAYCAWLFPLLSQLEQQTDLTGYSDYEKRIYGFLSERLLNVWIAARGLKAARRPVVQTERDPAEKRRMPLRRLRNRTQYALTRSWRRKELRKHYEQNQ